jgi:hypothetical protein
MALGANTYLFIGKQVGLFNMKFSFFDITIGLELFNLLITLFARQLGACELKVILLESLAPFLIIR